MDTRPDGPSVIGAGINFRSLSLGGVKGKVRATLTENQLSFESKTGHALDIKLDAIHRVHHHHTTLIPGWLAVVGTIFMWVAWRGVAGKLQALFGSIGIVLIASHFITRKPTITIDTKADDCHTIFGSDLSMVRLSTLIQNMQNGMSLEEAKMNVDNMVSDSDYPRTRVLENIEFELEPVELVASPVITHFIDSMNDEEDEIIDAEIISPAQKIDDLDIGVWDDGEVSEPQISEGLMERARENLFTQRNNVMQNGWQPEQQRQQPYNQIYRGSFQETYGQNHRQHMPAHPNVVPSPSPPPSEFLPSFFGANTAHTPIPQNQTFSSPDTPLNAPELDEEKPSLVAAARKSVADESNIVEETPEQPKRKYPGMSAMTSKTGRVLKSRKGRNSTLKSGFVLSELVRPIRRRRKISQRQNQTTETTEALRVQARNSSNEEIAQNIQNLARSNGGNVDDEEVERMMSHLERRREVPATFGELVRSDRSKSEAVNAIKRIEDEL